MTINVQFTWSYFPFALLRRQLLTLDSFNRNTIVNRHTVTCDVQLFVSFAFSFLHIFFVLLFIIHCLGLGLWFLCAANSSSSSSHYVPNMEFAIVLCAAVDESTYVTRRKMCITSKSTNGNVCPSVGPEIVDACFLDCPSGLNWIEWLPRKRRTKNEFKLWKIEILKCPNVSILPCKCIDPIWFSVVRSCPIVRRIKKKFLKSNFRTN